MIRSSVARVAVLVLVLSAVAAPAVSGQADDAPARKHPGTALALAIGPGLFGFQGGGQLYNNEVGKGVLFLGAGLVGLGLALGDSPSGEGANDGNMRGTIGLMIWLGSLTWSSIDAHRSAHRINREHGLAHADDGRGLRWSFGPGPGGGFAVDFRKPVGF